MGDDAVLLRLFVQGFDLIGGCFGGSDLEAEPDVLEADRSFFRDAQGAGKVMFPSATASILSVGILIVVATI